MMMNSLSKPKYTSGLNVYTLSKSKEARSGAKIKTVSINPMGHNHVATTVTLSPSVNKDSITNMQQSSIPNPNSFRQTGILSMKFKTTKSSRNNIIF